MLQINSAIGSFTGFSPRNGAACDSGMLPGVPCLMILILVFLPVPICSTSIIFSDNGISLLYLPRFVSKYSEVSKRWVRASEKGIRKIDLVARNNGARQTVYRLEGSTQELDYDDRKVAEHMTMAGNGLNKSSERRKD